MAQHIGIALAGRLPLGQSGLIISHFRLLGATYAVSSVRVQIVGYLIYGTGAEFEVEDRTLSHLKVAVSLKLHGGESFFVSWVNPVEKGSGRISLLVSPHIPLIFRFSGSRPPEINPQWINVLIEMANSPRGLVLISEREAEAYLRNKPEA